MGLFDFVKKQFIDVIEWTEPENGILSFRYPMYESQIQNGAKLTVRESQNALFIHKGGIADLFKPGLHTLNTENLPVLTNLENWDKAFKSPFKSDVYFFSLRDQLDQKWGTPNPVTIRDRELGPLRIRANGIYSYCIEDPKLFYKKVSGSRELFRSSDLDGQLFGVVTSNIGSFLSSSEVAFVDMAASQTKFSLTLQKVLVTPFSQMGLKLQSFVIQNLSLPEELQEHFDKAASQRVVGDLQRYTQFLAADSIAAAASNPSGSAGAGVGIGAGISLGQTMAQAISGNPAGKSSPENSVESLATLEKLHELLSKGVLTQKEFDLKKAEILKRM